MCGTCKKIVYFYPGSNFHFVFFIAQVSDYIKCSCGVVNLVKNVKKYNENEAKKQKQKQPEEVEEELFPALKL